MSIADVQLLPRKDGGPDRSPSHAVKVVHLSSVHRRHDVRIFLKECRSLVENGFDVTLVVADDLPDETRDGVKIKSVGMPLGRLRRMLTTTRRVAKQGLELDGELYHLHDPELLPASLWLKRRGKKVLYDAHEDLPEQVKGHSYLPEWTRPTVAWIAGLVVRTVCRRLDGVVAATPYIRDQFRAMDINSTDVSNFPILGELDAEQNWATKRRQVCYVGTIAAVRGVVDIVRAMEFVKGDVRLALGGQLVGSDVDAVVRQEAGWTRVDALGYLDRIRTRETMAQSVAGLVTLHPNGNYLNAQPVKLFEYMAAGIPVIASDFPLWRRIVEDAECGLLVDPLDPRAIAAAVDWLVDNPEAAQRMGESGRKAILKRYSWDVEKRRLFQFYDAILEGEVHRG